MKKEKAPYSEGKKWKAAIVVVAHVVETTECKNIMPRVISDTCEMTSTRNGLRSLWWKWNHQTEQFYGAFMALRHCGGG